MPKKLPADSNLELEEHIISSLGNRVINEKKLITKLEKALKGKPRKVLYKYLFSILAHLNLEAKEAEYYWEKISKHRAKIKSALGRDVGFRVSMLDYFINISEKIKNPLIIEIAIYMETLKTTLIDNLTGLYNNRYMEKSFKTEIKRSLRYRNKFSVMFLDLDNFKIYNDTYGHLNGDLALKNASFRMLSDLRAEDIMCRYGGEEFVVILPNTPKKHAFIVAERVRKSIRSMAFGPDGKKVMTISGGISTFPDDGKNMTKLLDTADEALYRAKRRGKNKIVMYSKKK